MFGNERRLLRRSRKSSDRSQAFQGGITRSRADDGMGRRIKLSALAFCAFLTAAVPALRAGAGMGNVFSVHCERIDHMAPDDPIVHPKDPGASHMHSFSGNTTTDAFSTYKSMVGKPTTCKLSLDTSGYWVPTMYDASGTVVKVIQFNAYYRTWGSVTKFTTFPPDFRLIAGGSTHDPALVGGGDASIGYNCAPGAPLVPTPPNCGTDWVKAHVIFPTCWDGVHTDSADHRSHVVYSTGGRCPVDHPVALPKLSFHVTYGVHSGKGLYLSSDEHEGVHDASTLHADFWNTWNQAALDKLVDACLNGSPRMSCLDVDASTFRAL
jgi:hypothetical protein